MLEAGTAGCQSKAPGPEIEICKSRPDDLLRLPAEVNRRSDYEDSAENCYSSKAFVQQGLTEQASNHRFKIQEHAGSRSWDPLQSPVPGQIRAGSGEESLSGRGFPHGR